MRINGIYIKNFLSFEVFEWSFLHPHLNIIVGPNGAGKTNLFYALRAIKEILNPVQGRQSLLWSQSVYRGLKNNQIELSLDIQLTEHWERELLYTFFAATLCNDDAVRITFNNLQNAGNETPFSDMVAIQEHFSSSLQQSKFPGDMEWLFSGKLIVTHKRNVWTSWYELQHKNQIFYLNMDSYSNFDNTIQKLYIRQLQAKKEVFTEFEQLMLNHMESLSARNMLPLQLQHPASTILETHQTFEQLTGITLTGNTYPGSSFVFYSLLEKAFVFSDNIRSQPEESFFSADLRHQPEDLRNGKQLARFLFLKKNGVRADREQFEAIQKLFCKMTGRTFEVSFEHIDASDRQDVVLSLLVSSSWGDIPLAFSGAGMIEALFICTLIASNTEQVLFLDEPASNMHVTMQRSLLNEIRSRNGSQFIIVTHSPALISPENITQVSRFSLNKGHTRRVALNLASIKDKDEGLIRLEKELRRSTDVPAMLFSRGVILVEGETEQAALPVWFQKHFAGSLEREDFIMQSVNGDSNFSNYIYLLQQFEIPWAVVCDGKVIGDRMTSGTQSRIIRQLQKAGISGLSENCCNDFQLLQQQLEQSGVFTLAENEHEEIEALPVFENHQQEAQNEVGNSKVRQAQYIAENYDCPEEVATLLNKVVQYLRKQDL